MTLFPYSVRFPPFHCQGLAVFSTGLLFQARSALGSSRAPRESSVSLSALSLLLCPGCSAKTCTGTNLPPANFTHSTETWRWGKDSSNQISEAVGPNGTRSFAQTWQVSACLPPPAYSLPAA